MNADTAKIKIEIKSKAGVLTTLELQNLFAEIKKEFENKLGVAQISLLLEKPKPLEGSMSLGLDVIIGLGIHVIGTTACDIGKEVFKHGKARLSKDKEKKTAKVENDEVELTVQSDELSADESAEIAAKFANHLRITS